METNVLQFKQSKPRAMKHDDITALSALIVSLSLGNAVLCLIGQDNN